MKPFLGVNQSLMPAHYGSQPAPGEPHQPVLQRRIRVDLHKRPEDAHPAPLLRVRLDDLPRRLDEVVRQGRLRSIARAKSYALVVRNTIACQSASRAG